MKKNIWFSLAILMIIVSACSSGKKYQEGKTPLDELIISLDKEPSFTILLKDMDVEGSWSKTYKHKYKVIKATGDSAKPFVEEETPWYEVSEQFFDKHVNNIGMELCSKADRDGDGIAELKKQVAPPGYSSYVGNERYGQWQTNSSGQSFWAFYGQYAMLQTVLGLAYGPPIYRSGYSTYYNSYYNTGRPYYGGTVSGRPAWGTNSLASQQANKSFHSRAASNSTLRNTVNSRISRSSSGGRYGSSARRSSSSSRGGK